VGAKCTLNDSFRYQLHSQIKNFAPAPKSNMDALGYPLKIEKYVNFKNVKSTNFFYSGVFDYGERDADAVFQF
jgi:hypothetical protein